MKPLGVLLTAVLAVSVIDSLWDDFKTYKLTTSTSQNHVSQEVK